MTSPRATSRITIDLAAVATNHVLLDSLVSPGCDVAGVVKANAYGLGIDKIVPLLDQRGCPLFFVATLDEGIAVRKLTAKPVAVLGGLYRGAEKEYLDHDLIPVMNSPEEIERRTYKGRCIWHIDTGMNRLGIRIQDLQGLCDTAHCQPFMLMTHFACADIADHPLTSDQVARFNAAAKMMLNCYPDIKRSLCNSSGVFRNSAWHADMVRPGMALYGLNPLPENTNRMRQTVTVETKLLQVKEAGNRESIGYGATYTLPRASRLGIVAYGYADGLPRSGSNQAYLYWKGRPCPVLGRISMDLTVIDLGDLDANLPTPHPGDWIEVIGPHQSADHLATSCGTIGYEVLTSLSPRAERIYLPAPELI